MRISDKISYWFLTFLTFYAFSLLIYVSLKYAPAETEMISAFGSILGAVATFFAAFIAIYLMIGKINTMHR